MCPHGRRMMGLSRSQTRMLRLSAQACMRTGERAIHSWKPPVHQKVPCRRVAGPDSIRCRAMCLPWTDKDQSWIQPSAGVWTTSSRLTVPWIDALSSERSRQRMPMVAPYGRRQSSLDVDTDYAGDAPSAGRSVPRHRRPPSRPYSPMSRISFPARTLRSSDRNAAACRSTH